jgi:hypothetical protein
MKHMLLSIATHADLSSRYDTPILLCPTSYIPRSKLLCPLHQSNILYPLSLPLYSLSLSSYLRSARDVAVVVVSSVFVGVR